MSIEYKVGDMLKERGNSRFWEIREINERDIIINLINTKTNKNYAQTIRTSKEILLACCNPATEMEVLLYG